MIEYRLLKHYYYSVRISGVNAFNFLIGKMGHCCLLLKRRVMRRFLFNDFDFALLLGNSLLTV
jgi:hypothetical protein